MLMGKKNVSLHFVMCFIFAYLKKTLYQIVHYSPVDLWVVFYFSKLLHPDDGGIHLVFDSVLRVFSVFLVPLDLKACPSCSPWGGYDLPTTFVDNSINYSIKTGHRLELNFSRKILLDLLRSRESSRKNGSNRANERGWVCYKNFEIINIW